MESDYHHRVRSYDNTSTLKIFSVEPRDRGTYICSAVNELGKTQTSAKISVDGMFPQCNIKTRVISCDYAVNNSFRHD